MADQQDKCLIEACITLRSRTNALLDCVRETPIYGKGVACLGRGILAIEACLEFFAARVAGVTREEVRARNMAKLAKRYPGIQSSTSAAIDTPVRTNKDE